MTIAAKERIKEVHIVHAFTSSRGGGNPAGVVLDADALTHEQRQKIAAEVGLSETAFISRSDVSDFRLDFYTPNRQIPDCGHATVAAFSLLKAKGLVGEGGTSKETMDGARDIEIRGDEVFMEQLAPQYFDPEVWDGVKASEVLASLGLDPGQLMDMERAGPVVVYTGVRFMLVGVRTQGDLAAIVPDQEAISSISEKLDLIGYYVFTTEGCDGDYAATSRMFAPRYAIAEESATGMAGGPLACLLHDRLVYDSPRIMLEQGRYMTPPSPSRITVDLEVEGGKIKGLMAGGTAECRETRELAY